MARSALGALVFVLGLCGSACGAEEPSAPAWALVFADEFDGLAGAPPSPEIWRVEQGGHGWGNQELQHYTDRPANVALDGQGKLVLTAREEAWQGKRYTSARLTTQGMRSWTYGRFEARLKIPSGKGLWPAFWLMGEAIDRVGWPECGEIDVMESRGGQPWRVSSALHGPGFSGGNAVIAGFELANRRSLADNFHLFAVEWDPDEIRFFVDDEVYHRVRRSRLLKAGVFDKPFFMLLNVAVGGTFGGPPDETTVFPQRLEADYIRVYQRSQAPE